MPEEIKILHAEVARSATTAKKLTFEENESESTQSGSPTVNAFFLFQDQVLSPFKQKTPHPSG